METLTRVLSESLARHGWDRPRDDRRRQWWHGFGCESQPSRLVIPSKPAVLVTPKPSSRNQSRAPESDNSTRIQKAGNAPSAATAPRLNSAIATTIHYSSSFPPGFQATTRGASGQLAVLPVPKE